MTAEACARCRTPFDPADRRFDGTAQSGDSGFCRRCVDVCHEATEFDHACPVCDPAQRQRRRSRPSTHSAGCWQWHPECAAIKGENT